MTEQDCKGMDHYQEKEGGILSRDVFLARDGKSYVITVSTADYWEAVQASGDEEGSTPYFVLEDVSDIKTVCESLAEIPLEELSPFLTESLS